MTRRKRPEERVQNPRYGGRWTKEADEILVGTYGAWFPATVAKRINTALGTRFTRVAVESRACQLGIPGKDCQGLLTVSEAARQLGILRSQLHKYIAAHELELMGHGHFRHLTDKTWRVVQEVYAIPPEPCITTTEAARRLHYTRDSIVDKIESGKVKAWKRGQQWRVSLADVERLEQIQRGDIGSTLERKRR